MAVHPNARADEVRRAAASGTTFYTLAFGFDILAQLVLFMYLARLFSIETFGRYALLTVAGMMLVALTDLGCGAALVRALADATDRARRHALIATTWWTRAAVALVVASIVAALGWSRPAWLSSEVCTALPAAAAAFLASCLFNVSQDALRGQVRHLRPALAQVLRAGVRTAAAIALVGAAEQGLAGLFLAVAAGSTAALLACLPPILRAIGSAPSLRLYREILAFGAPVGVYVTLRHASALDRYLIAYVLGVGAAGAYHVASMPCVGVEVFELAAAMALEPYIYRVGQERPEAVALLFRRAVFVVGGLSLLLGVAAPEILAVLAPESYSPALGAMPLLLFAAAARAGAHVLAFAAGHLRRTRIYAVTGVVDLLGSALLVPFGTSWFGLVGAGWARFLPALLSFAVCAALVGRIWPVPLATARSGLFLVAAAPSALWLAVHASEPFAAIGLRIAAMAALLLVGWLLLWRRGARDSAAR